MCSGNVCMCICMGVNSVRVTFEKSLRRVLPHTRSKVNVECVALQHTATHCNTLQHIRRVLPHTRSEVNVEVTVCTVTVNMRLRLFSKVTRTHA